MKDLGVAYGSLGQYQRAIEFYQQHLAIAKEIGVPLPIQNLKSKILSLWCGVRSLCSWIRPA